MKRFQVTVEDRETGETAAYDTDDSAFLMSCLIAAFAELTAGAHQSEGGDTA